MLASLSVTQLIFIAENGILILRSSIPLNLPQLAAVFLLRTVITLPVLALAGHVALLVEDTLTKSESPGSNENRRSLFPGESLTPPFRPLTFFPDCFLKKERTMRHMLGKALMICALPFGAAAAGPHDPLATYMVEAIPFALKDGKSMDDMMALRDDFAKLAEAGDLEYSAYVMSPHFMSQSSFRGRKI